MNIYVLTLFPEMFDGILNESILKRARDKKLVKFEILDIRDWATDKHKSVDDIPYGGGAGMIMKVDVIDKALHDIKLQILNNNSQTKSTSQKANVGIKILLTSPKGNKFDQAIAKDYSKIDNLIIICGHYGGVDARVNRLVDEIISIGDYVLTGGEIPAMAIIDSVTRLVDGVINSESLKDETHSVIGKNQFSQYTRPKTYEPVSKKIGTLNVPEVLSSGNHKQISEWRENNQK